MRFPSNSIFYKNVSGQYIKSKVNINEVVKKITEEGLKDYCESGDLLIGINSMMIRVYLMEHNIGAKIELPLFIKNSQSIVNPDSAYNMCFWNCLAYHEIKNKRCATKGKELFKDFYGVEPTKDYKGFDYYNEIDAYELKYKVGVNIFEMNEENKFNFVKKSDTEDNVINLLLYLNHFCYISKLDSLTKTSFMCSECGHCCYQLKDLNKHIIQCQSNEQNIDEFVDEPTIYEPERNDIIVLNEIYGTNCDFKYRPLIVYDFEALVIKQDQQLTDKLKINNFQKAVSVSLYSNIKGYENEIFIENENTEKLFNKMFDNLDMMCENAIHQMKIQFKDLYNAIENSNNRDNKKNLQKLNSYCFEVPIVGFNSGSYDINLNIEDFMNQLIKRTGQKHIFSIKNGNTFKVLKSGHYSFMDICQYLPPGYNLDSCVKSFNNGGLKNPFFLMNF